MGDGLFVQLGKSPTREAAQLHLGAIQYGQEKLASGFAEGSGEAT
jgi:hypothetical protein